MSIEASNISFSYEDRPIFNDFNFSAENGQCTAVVGRNGAGKSTLLKLLVGILRPTEGVILLDEESLWRKRTFRKDRVREDHAALIGYVMQKPERQLFAQTVFEDVAFGPKNLGLTENEINARVDKWLNYFGISNLADKSPYKISGGQQRMVAIAGVMAMETQNICFDEPSASLDENGVSTIHQLIDDLKQQNRCVVLVSHDDAEVQKLADRIVKIG